MCFPMAITYHQHEYDAPLLAVVLLVENSDWTGMSPRDVAQVLYRSDVVASVPGDKWYPAPVAKQPGIYVDL